MRFSWHGIFNFFCLRALRRLKKEVGVDVVYLTEMKLGKFLLRHKRKLNVPFVYEVHGLYAPGYERPDAVEGEVFHGCDALVTTTESLQEVMGKVYGDIPPLFRVPLASDIPREIPGFEPPARGESWRVCYIGQLYPLQGVDLMIRAMADLPKDVVFDVIGGRAEQIETLRRLAGEEGVEERIIFHGFVPPAEVVRRAAAAHLFVAPCRAEKKMPFVAHTKIYEYLALGRPLVVADLPSVREEIEDGTTGVLFRPEDPSALAQAVRKIIGDPSLAAGLAERGRRQARRYTWEKRAEGLVSCFGAACGET
jgi:glycosyltransferase involved in cell wall biosynthesis